MNIKEIGNVFHCDCGFSWHRGKNGNHNCADGLREKVRQLAAENVALKVGVLEAFDEMESHHDTNGLYSYDADGEQMDALIRLCDAQGTISDLLSMLETSATDRIVAGIKADAIDEAAVELDRVDTVASTRVIGFKLREFSQQLREGANHD
ncbi:TPA: hypothetical protein MDR33_000431 [Klebsiella pneumoniae]|nr:hypothetical protein [Klebsiella pneumoniae]